MNKRYKFRELPRDTHFKRAPEMTQNRCIIECDFLINILIIQRANKLLVPPGMQIFPARLSVCPSMVAESSYDAY